MTPAPRWSFLTALALAAVLGGVGCGNGDGGGDDPATTSTSAATTTAPPQTSPLNTSPPTTPAPTTAAPTSTSPPPTTAAPATAPPTTTAKAAPARPQVVEVRYRLERRTTDDATVGFADVVRVTLADERGWQRAGFRLVEDLGAPYLVVLAEPAEVDALCQPYRTNGRWSCQNGPVVALNADRWRAASEKWTGDLATYRQMLVNHEVGHLLGQRHPDPQCPEPGAPAAVMAQQSSELDGCLPNPWPLAWEIDLAARHEQPLAPGYGE